MNLLKKVLFQKHLRQLYFTPYTKKICANYRPISILPIISKILEKLVHKRLINYLDKYELLFKHQYGFQKGKSTEHAILDLHKNIVEAIEKKKRKHMHFSRFR